LPGLTRQSRSSRQSLDARVKPGHDSKKKRHFHFMPSELGLPIGGP
jgi:hypothetical protein